MNGELQYLPVSLLGGKVSIKQSGIYATLTTDFGLNVKYDWNMRLYITVPSSYYQRLGGLCGNYNGDRSDDLPEPKGKDGDTKGRRFRRRDVWVHRVAQCGSNFNIEQHPTRVKGRISGLALEEIRFHLAFFLYCDWKTFK